VSTSLLDPSPVHHSEGSAERSPAVDARTEERANVEIGEQSRPRLPGSRFFGNTSIRIKVIWITVVPLVAMFLFSGILARSVLDEAATASRIQDFARLGNESSTLVDLLQVERSAAAAYVTDPGRTADHPTLKHFVEQGRTTDADLRGFMAEYEKLDDDIAAPIDSEFEQVKRGYGVLTRNRDAVLEQARQGSGVRVGAAVTIYEQLITSLLQMKERLAGAAVGDEALSNQLTAVSAFAKYKEAVWQEQIVVRTALEDGNRRFTNDTFGAFRAAVSDESAFRSQFTLSATERQQEIRNTTLTQELTYQQLRTRAQNAGLGNPLSFSLATWLETSDRENSLLRSVETQLNTLTVQAAGSFRTDAMQKAIVVISAALGALVVALLVSLAVARSMIRPLVGLRSSALEVAYQSLPEVVRKLQDADQQTAAQTAAQTQARTLEVRSGDEIGQVAQAFNAIHLEAVRVASEQARLRQSVSAMFVNLSRRSQLLVDRLIRLIDGLEQGEQDPDRLSELFKLDHLATRMRRNDENLLVLGGADSGRSWSKPAPLVDVLRAAAAEVEQYTRVKLGSVDDSVEVASGAVNDTVHLIAEILENATSFSSPRTDVTVDARREGDLVVVEVLDQGIGMSRTQLAEFNERLAKPPVFDIAVSRMMGLFVVGRLASRHGIKVMLRDASGGGVLVMITLPATVLHRPAIDAEPPRSVERVASERLDRPAARSYVPTASFGANGFDDGPTGAFPTTVVSPAASTTFRSAAAEPDITTNDMPRRQPGAASRVESWNGFQTAADRRSAAPEAAPQASPIAAHAAPAAPTPPAPTLSAPTPAAVPPSVRTGPEPVVPADYGASVAESWAQPTQPLPTQASLTQLPDRTVEMPLPIFEATESDWFRARNLPRVPEAAGAGRQPQPNSPVVTAAPAPASALPPMTVPTTSAAAMPPAPAVPMAPAPAVRPVPASTPAAPPAPVAAGRPMASDYAVAVDAPGRRTGTERWQSPADAGWRAARAVAEAAPAATTTAGLPKRVPMAHYVPGRVEQSAAKSTTRRSPEAVRGVLSSYRSGLEQGRQVGHPARTGTDSAKQEEM